MEFAKHLENYLSKDEIDSLLNSLTGESLHAVLLNTRKMSDELFLSLYPNVKPHPIVKHAYLYDKKEYELGKSIYHELGCFYLQEPSAMLPAYYLNCNENDLVLDLCAAPGGKTVQSSFLMKNKGLIVSNDLSFQRAGIIKENAERLGLGNLLIISNDFEKIYRDHINQFDKIILDAPCSGSGMFRKMEEMKDDWSYNKVTKFAEVQKTLISIAYKMLKPGGIISYSTCSFSYEEDEEVIKYLLENTDAEIVNIPDNPLLYKSKDNIGVHTFPNLFPGEGHYLCLIKKPGTIVKRLEEEKPTFLKFGEAMFQQNTKFNTRNLNIIRNGIKVGEVSGQVIKYDIHYAHYIDKFENELEISEEDLISYMKGNTLNIQANKGFILLKYKGINVDIAKSDGSIIKNRYPKYLRH